MNSALTFAIFQFFFFLMRLGEMHTLPVKPDVSPAEKMYGVGI